MLSVSSPIVNRCLIRRPHLGRDGFLNTHRNEQFFQACCCRLASTGDVSCIRVTCSTPTDAPFLSFDPLSQAESLWQEAERAVAHDDELLARVRQGHLAVQSVWMARWEPLRQACSRAGATWPVTTTRGELARQWLATADGIPSKLVVKDGSLRKAFRRRRLSRRPSLVDSRRPGTSRAPSQRQ